MLAGLSQLTTRGVARLSATLKGVAGFTGSGALRYVERGDASRRLDAELSGLAGLKAEIVINGAPFAELACRNGVAAGRFDGARGATIPPLCDGDTIEIRQNGVIVLKGRLKAPEA